MKDLTGNTSELLCEKPRQTTGSAMHMETVQAPPVVLDRMQEISSGDKEFELELFDTFLTDSQERIRNMESALQDMNLEIFRVQAHSLKGASATAGAETMTALALSMEETDPDGDARNMHQLMEDLKQEYEKVRLFLGNYLGIDFPPL